MLQIYMYISFTCSGNDLHEAHDSTIHIYFPNVLELFCRYFDCGRLIQNDSQSNLCCLVKCDFFWLYEWYVYLNTIFFKSSSFSFDVTVCFFENSNSVNNDQFQSAYLLRLDVRIPAAKDISRKNRQ